MADPEHLYVLIAALLFSAFFSGSEMAFVSASKIQIELEEKQGSLSGRILMHFLNYPTRLVATLIIGNTISLAVYGLILAAMLHQYLWMILPPFLQNSAVILILQTVGAAILAMVTAEFLPRSLFSVNPNAMLRVLAVPLLVLYYLLYPVVFLIVRVTRFITERLLKWEFSEQSPVFAVTDVDQFALNRLYQNEKNAAPAIDPVIFHNALEFQNVKVKECMVPRTEIEAVEVNDDIEVLRDAFVSSGHSKILVYRDTIDNIVGYCHQLTLFKQPLKIADILSTIPIVTESMPASELLVKLINEHRSIALVVDEFGGTSGIVTIEDVIEEIIGDIQDEYDDDALLEQEVSTGKYLFSARLEIDYLNEKYQLNLPEGDYETLGGFILATQGDIPQVGDLIQAPPYVVTIVSMDENRINIVELVHHQEISE